MGKAETEAAHLQLDGNSDPPGQDHRLLEGAPPGLDPGDELLADAGPAGNFGLGFPALPTGQPEDSGDDGLHEKLPYIKVLMLFYYRNA